MTPVIKHKVTPVIPGGGKPYPHQFTWQWVGPTPFKPKHQVVENPYWWAIQRDPQGPLKRKRPFRMKLIARYAWTISDPVTVEFVVAHSSGSVIDPMAGTGYWPWLLQQSGIDVICYDLFPPGVETSKPETIHWDAPTYVPVQQGDAPTVIPKHPERMLLLGWPRYDLPTGAETIQAYSGGRFIYMGDEGHDCSCGTDEMWDLLATEWVEVARRRPVRWAEIEDWVIVYDRKNSPRAVVAQ